jgi:lysophospholipase L1-like esterase
MQIPADSRLVMIGDSVTDCGRARPVGTGPAPALGHGYVAQVDTRLRALHPERPVHVYNVGTSGDTVRDLAARWATDVTALRPDWLSVMIGINDVWRFFDPDPVKQAQAVLPPEFEATYDALLTRARPQLKGLVLMTPFFVEPSPADPMRVRMDAYGAIVRRLATRHGARLADTQAAFDRHLATQPAATLAPDRVHPTEAGHQVLAQAFLVALGP